MRRSRAKADGCTSEPLAHSAKPNIELQVPRVFVVSGVRLVREALAACLSRDERVAVVGVGEPSPGVVPAFLQARADIVLLDMSGFSSIDAARNFVASAAPAKVVAFSVAQLENEVLACAESGMAGFVPRHGTIEDLVSAVEGALRGELRCSPRVAGLLFDRLAQLSRHSPGLALPLLTRREREIGGLIVLGLSNKAIAEELRIGTATVKNHVHSILDKLQVRRRGEAAARLRDRVM